jgi:hypothetical protein
LTIISSSLLLRTELSVVLITRSEVGFFFYAAS